MDSSSETLTETARDLLQRDIIVGTLPPSSRLGVRMLTEAYGIGPTPIREALSRLVETGLISAHGRRGFTVAPLSRADLADILWLRRTVEVEALRRSLRDGDAEWEAEIAASLHLLRRAAVDVIEGGAGSPLDLAFDAVHRRFHRSLLAACGSDRLLLLAARLYDQTFRYRRLAMRADRWTRDVVAEHERLAALALDRSDDAAALLDRHVADVMAMAFPGD